MKKYIPLFISMILLLPQCTGKQTKKTFKDIQAESKKRIKIAPEWINAHHMHIAPNIHNENITMQKAIAFGLEHNPNLQAHFEEIGIKKSDLIQAGFYSNPHIESIFRLPTKDTDLHTNMEFSAMFTLSDLWQVPLRKKMAQRELETKTHEIMKEILLLRKNIQQAYLLCIYKKEQLSLVQEITSVVQSIKDRIDYRYQFGYNSDLDKYFSLSTLAKWQTNIVNTNAELDMAYIQLHHILGIPISSKTLALTTPLTVPAIHISQEELEKYALLSHPQILIEQSKIAKANAEIRYEKSQILGNVKVGISYEQDFEKKARGVGPAIGIDIPLFNTNYGKIERAKYAKKLAEKSLLTQKRLIFANLSEQFMLYNSYLKQIKLYKQYVIPPTMKAIEFSKEFFDKMQMDMIVFLETQIKLFQSKLMLLELMYKAEQIYIELEFSAGSQLQNINTVTYQSN